MGDEGGFAPNVQDNSEALDVLMEAIKKSGHEGKVKIGTDVAASEFWRRSESAFFIFLAPASRPELKKYDLDFKNESGSSPAMQKSSEAIDATAIGLFMIICCDCDI